MKEGDNGTGSVEVPRTADLNIAGAASLRGVSIKPPLFMETSAAAWFSIMEAQFILGNITVSSTKFYHVLAALPPETVTRISASTLNSANYSVLKSDVISLFEKSKPELFDKLISTAPTITDKPSLFLEHLISIADKLGVGEELIKHKFITGLPQNIAPVVASQKDLGLKQLGSLADELLPYFQQTPVMQIPHNINNSTKPSSFNKPSNFHKSSIGLTPFHDGQRQRVCRAHIFYGPRAKSCKPWCMWPDKSACRLSPSSRPTSRDSSPGRQEN